MEHEELIKKQADFTRLLLKTPLEPFTSKLWDLFSGIASGKYVVFSNEEAAIALTELMTNVALLAKNLLSIQDNEPVKIGKDYVTSPKALEALKQALIEDYCHSFCILEEIKRFFDEGIITPEELTTREQLVKTIEKCLPKGKQGKCPQNLELLYLIRQIRIVYKGHSNNDYRLIFDCMDLFGFINDEVKKAWDKKNNKELNAAKTQYIKAAYNQVLQYETRYTFPITSNGDIWLE